MLPDRGLVSVIIPAYNAEKYIAGAIRSVLAQTYPYLEIIVVDDGSTDATVQVVQSFTDERIKLLRHPRNRGPGAARNTALDVAQGRWFTPLDADDEWLPERLERLVDEADNAGDGYFIADDLLVCFDTPAGLKPWDSWHRRYNRLTVRSYLDFTLADWLRLRVPGMVPLVPLGAIKEAGLTYHNTCSFGEDFELYCRLFRAGLTLRLIGEAYYLYRLTPGSLTRRADRVTQLGGVYSRLMALPDLTAEERVALERWFRSQQLELQWCTFADALKHRNWLEAMCLGIKRPYLPVMLLFRLRRAIRYWLVARRIGTLAA